MRFKALLRNVALVPILAPSLLAAISFIFWFGNQGVLKALLFGGQIYGAPGIVISLVFATFPHAVMILVTALSLTDARLYEAADAWGRRRRASSGPSRSRAPSTASSARPWWCSPTRSATSASPR
jgi:ABC-type Fe3+ transport system permease subunit